MRESKSDIINIPRVWPSMVQEILKGSTWRGTLIHALEKGLEREREREREREKEREREREKTTLEGLGLLIY